MTSLVRTVRACIEAIFPKRHDAVIVDALAPGELTDLSFTAQQDACFFLLPFHDERVRACIHEAKYHRNPTAVDYLGAVLRQYLVQHKTASLVVPIPLSAKRLHKRGYNQVELILKAAQATHTHHTVVTDMLVRTKDTQPQTSLQKEERLQNVANAFGVRDPDHAAKTVHGKHIIVLDDVATTGATLRAAKAALLPLRPASVTCLALAH